MAEEDKNNPDAGHSRSGRDSSWTQPKGPKWPRCSMRPRWNSSQRRSSGQSGWECYGSKNGYGGNSRGSWKRRRTRQGSRGGKWNTYDDDDDDDEEENAHRLRSAPMQGGRASLWGLVPPADMKAEEVDDATPKMLTGSASGKRMELSTPY